MADGLDWDLGISISSAVSNIMPCTNISVSKHMLVLFEFRNTQAGVELLYKATMPFGVSFYQEEICHKYLHIFWQGFPISYQHFFCYFWKKIQYAVFFPVLLFQRKKKSFKCANVIIKQDTFTWIPLFLFSLHWQLKSNQT